MPGIIRHLNYIYRIQYLRLKEVLEQLILLNIYRRVCKQLYNSESIVFCLSFWSDV
jgi:hypothetical protein